MFIYVIRYCNMTSLVFKLQAGIILYYYCSWLYANKTRIIEEEKNEWINKAQKG